MLIKIDLELLNAQIQECDIKADNASSEEEREAFEGVSNLLSNISYALENGDEIRFEVDNNTEPTDDDLVEMYDEEYIPSAENGDYSPSNPWDAPGMKMSDFI